MNQAGRTRCEPGWRLDRHFASRLTDYDLWFVWSGRGVMQLPDRQVQLRPGICIWMRPGEPGEPGGAGGLYQCEQDLNDRLVVNHIHFDLVDHQGRVRSFKTQVPGEVHDLPDVGYADTVLRRIVALMQQAAHAHAPGTIDHGDPAQTASLLLTALLMDIDRWSQQTQTHPLSGTRLRHHHTMAQIAAQISEHPGDVPATSALAKTAGYSPDHFTRVFRSVHGQSPKAFILHARIERAKQLLTESDLTISQIADVLGYRDVFYFSSQFKKLTGTSPSTFGSPIPT